ncbi:hypothetical protein D3C79_683030 [compost metagenome]
MHIAAWQLRRLGDVGHGSTGVALLSKDLLGGQEDIVDIALANAELVLGHDQIHCD